MVTLRFAFDLSCVEVVSEYRGPERHAYCWPVLDYEDLGKDGDFTAPLKYNLEAVEVGTIGSAYQYLRWTRKIPVDIKNQHREFWGMRPLRAQS